MTRPLVIALEGIDGSGTTTQAAAVAERLRVAGYTVHTTRQPSGGPIGKLVRQALAGELGDMPELAMALLFAADREEQRTDLIDMVLPARPRHGVLVVLTDRSYISTLVYQPEPIATQLAELAPGIRPDLAVLLRVSPAVAQARREARGGRPERYDHERAQRDAARRYDTLFTERGWPVLSGELAPEVVTAQLTGLIIGQLEAHRVEVPR
jgi:dTMP kinase